MWLSHFLVGDGPASRLASSRANFNFMTVETNNWFARHLQMRLCVPRLSTNHTAFHLSLPASASYIVCSTWHFAFITLLNARIPSSFASSMRPSMKPLTGHLFPRVIGHALWVAQPKMRAIPVISAKYTVLPAVASLSATYCFPQKEVTNDTTFSGSIWFGLAIEKQGLP